MDLIALYSIRGFLFVLNLIPYALRLKLLSGITRLIVWALPSYRRIAMRNLDLAFPQATQEWKRAIMRDSEVSLARVLVDFARLSSLDAKWVEAHVDCPMLQHYREIKRAHPHKGVLIATGHLGSFELLAHCMPHYGHPISFVVRNFKLPRVDRWWTDMREKYGNKVINRQGAFKDIMHDLEKGRDVALLFDQNVTRNHAVFVDFFGRKAATTKALGLAALKSESSVIVASVGYLGNDRYKVEAVECDFSQIYADSELSRDEKVLRITQRVSTEYEHMIRKNPGEWFWMHRRWKTAPEGEPEDFYAK